MITYFRTVLPYIYSRQIDIIKRLWYATATRYLCTTRFQNYAMSSHTRETALFSEMDETMRRLGSWEPRPPGADA
jgi:hypothetical protein